MRHLLLATVLLGSVAHAQTAADSALVDQALDALGYGFESDSSLATAFAPSVRQSFLETLDTALLAQAISVLEGEAYARTQEVSDAWRQQNLGSAVLEGPQADSARVAGYVVAMLDATQPDGVYLEVVDEARRSLPDSALAALDEFEMWDELTGGGALPFTQRLYRESIRASRYQLADLDPSDLEAMTAYYRSDAGRYVGRRVAVGLYRATVLPMIEMAIQLSRMSEALEDG
ncbi:hypothetical protein [Rubrivirga sp.]|uniref:hypothetical protein n=1 Tax=Rubrivirga sp. TaxID=1885344 RepID=UPI003C73D2C5